MGRFCMGRLFYFYALSIFHYFLKWTCPLFIKSTHSTKKKNWHSTFLKKGLGRFLDGRQDRRVKSIITLSNLLLCTDEQIQPILRSHKFACKKEAPGDHSDLVPSMAGAWLLKSPFHLLLGWKNNNNNKKSTYHSWEDTPTRAGAQVRLGVGKCPTVPRAWAAQGLVPRMAREQECGQNRVIFSFLGITQTPDLNRLHYLLY